MRASYGRVARICCDCKTEVKWNADLEEWEHCFDEPCQAVRTLTTVTILNGQVADPAAGFDQRGLESEVAECFEDFWKPIVAPDGEWDLDQVKRELYDFRVIMEGASKVYYEITLGRISKPNTDPRAVIAVHNEVCHKDIDKQLEMLGAMADYYRDMSDVPPGTSDAARATQIIWTRTRDYLDAILAEQYGDLPFVQEGSDA